MTCSSWFSSQSRTKLLPMKPAPPVTRIMMFLLGRLTLRRRLRTLSGATVVSLEPLDETPDPHAQGRLRRHPGPGCQRRHVRMCRDDIARLHRLVLPDRLDAQCAFDRGDEVAQRHG